ncbi:hypothetical protein K1719_021046 [Acacia pycnantha]|nr:hypothetical protein K1719_021046 [Acacia pycnantha]
MKREAIESPETSPATMKTRSSPSFAAISRGALALENDDETDAILCFLSISSEPNLSLFKWTKVVALIFRI